MVHRPCTQKAPSEHQGTSFTQGSRARGCFGTKSAVSLTDPRTHLRDDHMSSSGTGSRRSWTQDEEMALAKLHSEMGPTWARIAQQLGGRTEKEVRCHYNIYLRCKRLEKHTDSILAIYVWLLRCGAYPCPDTYKAAVQQVQQHQERDKQEHPPPAPSLPLPLPLPLQQQQQQQHSLSQMQTQLQPSSPPLQSASPQHDVLWPSTCSKACLHRDDSPAEMDSVTLVSFTTRTDPSSNTHGTLTTMLSNDQQQAGLQQKAVDGQHEALRQALARNSTHPVLHVGRLGDVSGLATPLSGDGVNRPVTSQALAAEIGAPSTAVASLYDTHPSCSTQLQVLLGTSPATQSPSACGHTLGSVGPQSRSVLPPVSQYAVTVMAGTTPAADVQALYSRWTRDASVDALGLVGLGNMHSHLDAPKHGNLHLTGTPDEGLPPGANDTPAPVCVSNALGNDYRGWWTTSTGLLGCHDMAAHMARVNDQAISELQLQNNNSQRVEDQKETHNPHSLCAAESGVSGVNGWGCDAHMLQELNGLLLQGSPNKHTKRTFSAAELLSIPEVHTACKR